MIGLLIMAAETSPGVPIDRSAIIVALITAVATFGGAYLMFRGKTQDTAHWLVHELRTDASSARSDAADAKREAETARQEVAAVRLLVAECERHREQDRRSIAELQARLERYERGTS